MRKARYYAALFIGVCFWIAMIGSAIEMAVRAIR